MLDGEKDSYDVMLYGYSGMNSYRPELKLIADVVIENKDVKDLYYNIKVPFDAIEFLPENTYEYQSLIDILEQGAQIVNMMKIPSEEFNVSVKKANEFLQSRFGHKYTVIRW